MMGNMNNIQPGLVSPQVAQQVVQQQQQFQQMQPPQQAPLQNGAGQVVSVEAKTQGTNQKGEPWQKYSIKVADAMQQGRTLTYTKFAKMINGIWEVMPTMGQYIDFAYSIKPNPKNVQYPFKTIIRWAQKQNTPQLQQAPPQQQSVTQGAPVQQTQPMQTAPQQPQLQPAPVMQQQSGVITNQVPVQQVPLPPQPATQNMPQGTFQNQGTQIMQIVDSDIPAFKQEYLKVAQQKGITPEENHFLGTYIKNKMPNDPMVQRIFGVFNTNTP